MSRTTDHDFTEAANDEADSASIRLMPGKGTKTQQIHGAQPAPPPSAALIARPDGTYTYRQFRLTKTGVIFPDGASEKDFYDFGIMVLRSSSAVLWWIGDWILYGQARGWQDIYKSVAEDFGYDIETLHNIASIARKVDTSRRRDVLSFAHHATVASKDPDEQERWLGLAEGNGWNVKQLRASINPKPPALSSGIVGEFVQVFAQNHVKFGRLANKVERAGGSEKSQITQLLDTEIEWLRDLKRLVEGDE